MPFFLVSNCIGIERKKRLHQCISLFTPIINYLVKHYFSARLCRRFKQCNSLGSLAQKLILIGIILKGTTLPCTSRGIKDTRCQSWKPLKTPFLYYKSNTSSFERLKLWCPLSYKDMFYLFGNLQSIYLGTQTVMGDVAI